MTHDHEAAKVWAQHFSHDEAYPLANLAACYLDSVPKAKYDELLARIRELEAKLQTETKNKKEFERDWLEACDAIDQERKEHEELLRLAKPFAALKLTESEVMQDAQFDTGKPVFAKNGAIITVRDILLLRAFIEKEQP